MNEPVPTIITLTNLWIAAAPILLVALGTFINSIRNGVKSDQHSQEIKVAIDGRLTQLIEVLREKGVAEADLAAAKSLAAGIEIGHAKAMETMAVTATAARPDEPKADIQKDPQ